MKKIIIVTALLALSACGSSVHLQAPVLIKQPVAKKTKQAPAPLTPVVIVVEKPQVVVPALPEFLSGIVPPLPLMVDGTIKGIMRDGAHTDSMYNNLAARYKALRKAYECVRDSVNSRDASKVCI